MNRVGSKCRVCGKTTRKPRCPSCETKVRRFRCKQAAVKLLGGSCVRCGYDGHIAAFQFHHKDPKKKAFNVGRVAQKSWKVIKVELKKCELVCVNCHHIAHATAYSDPRFLAELKRYKGTEPFK